MKEQFVTYNIALKLEQLGFNEKCFGYYKTTLCNNIPELNIIQCNYNSGKYITIPEDFLIDAPLWQQVIDWFNKNKSIIIDFSQENCGFINYDIKIKKSTDAWDFFLIETLYSEEIDTNDYKIVIESAILKVIELIKNK